MDKLDCNKALINKFDDSIVLIEYTANENVEAHDLSHIERSIGTLIGNHPYFAISVLPQSFKNFSIEAKNFITEKTDRLENRLIDCYVTDSLSKRLELEVFFQFHKPSKKTKIFTSLNKALTFIEGEKKLEVNKKGALV
ncbi:MAG: hypothetical protein AB8B72_01705 [Crocinitomicaceae bacterium]